MPELAALQRQFLDAVYGGSETDVCRAIMGDTLPASARLHIYRNDVTHNLREALRAVFPVVERLTGADWFRQAARAYLRAHPSERGDIHAYGEDFPAMLANLPDAPVYLADVAGLEWRIHESFHASDAEATDFARLAGVTAERRAGLRFRLHPACRLCASDYPVLRIWKVNQPAWDGDPAVDLGEGGASLLVHRPGSEVELRALNDGESAFLDGLVRGLALGELVETLPSGADLGALLRAFAAIGVIVDFEEGD
jgi:hypothetical protein